MYFERIISEGLAHFSYILGNGGKAVVIDPRRDCDIYIEKTIKKDMRITHILETHRNEDYLIGSLELSSLTGAEIWHADTQWDYKYGQPVEEGQKWKLGNMDLEALHTPGHTPGSMSYLLHDPSGAPWMIFCGDALFAGDVGRVDLMGMDRAEEMAGMLYDSLFQKLLPLGDEVLLYPAHGMGSVCGASIAPRMWTTIGLERKLNPKIQARNKQEFISSTAKELERPPYFKQMERSNLEGPRLLGYLPYLFPLSLQEFSDKKKRSHILDTRMELDFSSAFVSGSLSIWLDGIASFTGWFLSYDSPVLLVTEAEDPTKIVRLLLRMGYDDLEGFLSGGIHSWLLHGMPAESINTLMVQDFCRKLDKKENLWILDVRSEGELDQNGRIPGAHHIHITQLLNRMSDVPKDNPVYIFCGSGLRSMTAASFLKRNGWDQLSVILGGFAGWNSITCPIQKPHK